jgi:hypothetical protein
MSPNSTAVRHPVGSEGGFALLMAILTLLLLAGIIVAGTDSGLAGQKAGAAATANPMRAKEIAAAGLADALSWFRRQHHQPVSEFTPARDLSADPVVNETDDATVGLVREYEVAPSVWARYEVRLTQAEETYTDENGNGVHDEGEAFVDADGSGKWDVASGTRDISALRGEAVSGTVWLIESHGFLFARPHADVPLGEGHNTRIGAASLGTEIRRMAIAPPAGAAVCAAQGGNVVLGNRARVRGGAGAAVAFADGTGNPTQDSGSEVSGSPSVTSVPGYDGSLKAIFGLDLTQLKSMADLSTNDANALQGDVGEFTLTVIEDSVLFNAARPLRGTGVVIIQGNCVIESGSNSFFNGLLWVSGDLDIRAPSYLRGLCVCNGDVDVRGTGGDYAEIDYDDKIIDDLLVRMGRYRTSKSVFAVGELRPLAGGGK